MWWIISELPEMMKNRSPPTTSRSVIRVQAILAFRLTSWRERPDGPSLMLLNPWMGKE
jgi:hypothetical protein